MNQVENGFKIRNIKAGKEKVILDIRLCCSSETMKDVYLLNYYEGVFLEENGKKYRLYAEITEEGLAAEVCYDTVLACISNKNEHLMRLWVRLRIGNTILEQPVEVMQEIVKIGISHWMALYFYPVSDYRFCFTQDGCDAEWTEGRKNGGQQAVCNSVAVMRDGIKLDMVVIGLPVHETLTPDIRLQKEDFNRKFTLVWRDVKGKKSYFFHPQTVEGTEICYVLTVSEMERLNRIEADNRIFEWLLMDEVENEYKVVAGETVFCSEAALPVRDYMAYLYEENGFLFTKMTSYISLEICGTDKDSIIFQYQKRSYPIEIQEVIARRVNTDLEYVLPMEVIRDEKAYIRFSVRLCFEKQEEAFRTGVYQFFLTIRDGFYVNRVPLKNHRNKKLEENTYIVMDYPYAIIGERYYSCMFYNDTSSNLKCSIQRKLLKAEIIRCVLENDCLDWCLRVSKEAFFRTNFLITLETEAKQLLPAEQFVIRDSDMWCEIGVRIDVKQLCEQEEDLLIYPMLGVSDNPEISMFIQNNRMHPPVSRRETRRFSFVRQTDAQEYRRIWGDYKNGAYMLGITQDLEFAILQYAEYQNGTIRLAVTVSEEMHPMMENTTAEIVLEHGLTGEKIKGNIDSCAQGAQAELDISGAAPGEYFVYICLGGGMRSGLKVLQGLETYFAYEQRRKILLQKKEEKLVVAVKELLLYEIPQEVEACRTMIEEARSDTKNSGRKIWLIGENYGLSARDNGLALFEFCMKNNTKDAEVYFVTKRENADIECLKPYMDHVVIYDTEEHIKLDALAEFYIVSHGIRDVMPSLYHNRLGEYRKPVVYLQHGVAAMKKFGISNQSYGKAIRKFVVSSEFEKNLLVKNRQFWEDEIAVTGLSRYDKLTAENGLGQNYIWMMPTWRDWLVESVEQFRNSMFYKSYCDLLQNQHLLKSLREKNCRIVFSLHNEFEKYKPLFESLACDVVEISDQHEVAVSRRIKECSMIVTDYSSIIFDVVYLHKPALFFQFDQDAYIRARGSYVDLETELPGEVVHTSEELVRALTELVNDGFREKAAYEERRSRFFDYEDCGNSKRIYQAILALREEMADEYEHQIYGL